MGKQLPARDDGPTEPTAEQQARALRENFDKFTDFIAREMIEMVMLSDPFLAAYKRAGETLNQSVNLDAIVYVICHRLLVNGIGFNNRLMQMIADKLNLAPLSGL